jgi:hypothetical protein
MVETEQLKTAQSQPLKPPWVHRSVAFDISELDNGLLQLLLPNVQSMFRYMRCSESSTKLITSTSIHILKAIMLYATQLYSPAMRHLNVKVIDTNASSTRRGERHVSYPKIYRYIIITCLLPFLHELIKYKASVMEEEIRLDDCEELAPMSVVRHRLARGRQAMILQILMRVTSIVVPPIHLYHHLYHILNPQENQTPSFTMNDNGLSYQYDKSNQGTVERKINFLYAHRKIWFEEFMLTVGILPFDVWRNLPQAMRLSYRRILVQLNVMIPTFLRQKKVLDEGPKDEYSCAICSLEPIVIPYKTSCGHVYCYTCLKSALVDNFHYRCMVCGEKVVSNEPLRIAC